MRQAIETAIFTIAGKEKFLSNLLQVLKNPEEHNLKVWIAEAEQTFAEQQSSFEVSSQYTKSGNPVLIDVRSEDFDVTYIQEEET